MRQSAWATFAVVNALSFSISSMAEEDTNKDADKTRKHEELFVQLDANGDGEITIDEVPEDQQPLLKRLIKRGDADANGQLSQEEFLAALTEKRATRPLVENPEQNYAPGNDRPDPRMIFRQLDANGDGVVRVEELPEKLQGFFSNIMEKADKDGDEALGPEELGKVIRTISERRPELLRNFGLIQPTDASPRDGGLMRALDSDGNGELSSEEIAKASQVLQTLDTDNDGLVSRDELHAPPALALADQQQDRPTPEKILQRIMQADSDGDGRVSRDEAPERMLEHFDHLDANGDNFLDRDELSTALKARFNGDARKRPGGPQGEKNNTKRPSPEQIIKHIMQSDQNGDQKISRDEAPERMQRAFDHIDTNGDGFLDRQEITAGAKAMMERGRKGAPKKDRKKRPGGGKRDAKRPNPEQLFKHIMQADKDGDQRISRDEAPERMLRVFDHIDTNGDDFLDREEITASVKAMIEKGHRKNSKRGRKGQPQRDKKRRPNSPGTP